MLTGLNHVNISTNDLEGTIAFYEGVLGMTSGPKPSGNPGAWLFVDGQAVVHVDIIDELDGSGPANFNHVAFDGTDVAVTTAALNAASVDYKVVERPDLGITQVLCTDPNNIPLEVNIPTEF